MGKRSRNRSRAHESFSDIVKEVESNGSTSGHITFSAPVSGPFGERRWTDAAGVEWKLRHAGRGRLMNLLDDPEVPVRVFDRWTAEVHTLHGRERQEVIDDFLARRYEIDDFCDGMDIDEAYSENSQSEVWVGRI